MNEWPELCRDCNISNLTIDVGEKYFAMEKLFRVLPYLWFALGALASISLVFLIAHIIDASSTQSFEPYLPLIIVDIMSLCLAALLVMNGILMLKTRRRMISLVLSVIICLAFPVGTILGVLSLIALNHPKIKEQYS